MYRKEKMARIIKEHIETGRTIKSLAAEHGMAEATISRAKKEYLKQAQEDEVQRRVLEAMERNRKLLQENEALKKENDFLKKAAAFFAKGE